MPCYPLCFTQSWTPVRSCSDVLTLIQTLMCSMCISAIVSCSLCCAAQVFKDCCIVRVTCMHVIKDAFLYSM